MSKRTNDEPQEESIERADEMRASYAHGWPTVLGAYAHQFEA